MKLEQKGKYERERSRKKDKEITIQNNSSDYSDILNRILGKSKTTLFFVVFIMFVLSYWFGYTPEKPDTELDIFNIIWCNIFSGSKINIPLTFVFSSFCILIARFIYSLGLSGLVASLCEKCYFWMVKYFAKLYIDYSRYIDVLEIKLRKSIDEETKDLILKYQKPIEIILNALDDVTTYKDNRLTPTLTTVDRETKTSKSQPLKNLLLNDIYEIKNLLRSKYPKIDEYNVDGDLEILIKKCGKFSKTIYLERRDNTIFLSTSTSPSEEYKKILEGGDTSEFINLCKRIIDLKHSNPFVENNSNIERYEATFSYGDSYTTQLTKTIRTLYKK